MNDEPGHDISTTRIETFTDAVIAIIATLLILEIKVPELHDVSTLGVLRSLVPIIPKFVSFAVSFTTICIFWVNHHHFMHSIQKTDNALPWYNNHLLFWLAVIPFVTAFIGDYPHVSFVVALYGFVFAMAGLAFALMGRHAFFKANLMHDHVPEELKKSEYRRAYFGVISYAIAVLTAFIHPSIALAIYLIIPLYYFMPRSID